MIRKVHRLERLARGGYRLLGTERLADGGLVVHLGRSGRREHLRFEHFEVPAVLHMTAALPFAS